MKDTKITIGNPKNFRMHQVLIENFFGLVLGLPLGVALGVGVGASVGGIGLGSPTLLLAAVIALLVSAAILFFMPVMLGNPYIKRLVRNYSPGLSTDATPHFLVQLALHPRLHGGIRGWLEDADDIGYLSISATSLSFHGDHVVLDIPAENINGVQSRNVGYRGLWFCGRRIRITSPLPASYSSVEFMDRSAIHVPGCRSNTEAIMEAIASIVKQGRPDQAL